MRPLDPSVLPYLRPGRAALTTLVLARVVESLLVVAQAFVVAGAVVAMVGHHRLTPWIVLLLSVSVARALTSYVGEAAAARAAARAGAALRRRLLATIVRRRQPAGAARSAGSLVLLATRGVQETEPYLTRYLPALVLSAVLPPVAVVAIATQDLLSALIVALTLPLVPLFAALVGWRTRDRAARQWRQLGQLAGHFLDVVKGLPTLVSFRRAEQQTTTIRQVTHRYRRATMSTLRLAFASSAVLELVATISVALVAVCVGLRLAAGSLDLRTALVVLLLAPEAYWPLRRVGAEFHAAAQGAAAFVDAGRVLSRPASAAPAPWLTADLTADLPADLAGDVAEGGVAMPAPPGLGFELNIEAAEVRYPGRPTAALAATTVRLRGPGLVAVTGPSGVGKSTLLAAVQGRLSLSAGTVSCNGVPLELLDPAWWRSQVSWLPQRPFLVRGTVADNLRLGKPHASDGELWSALDQVGLTPTVSALPGGLEAPMGEDGLSMSAGERARVALARAVLARRPVVLLDEPSAHLDPQSERVVIETMRALAADALVIAVAHQPAVARSADRVVELSAPSGTPVPDACAPAATAVEPCRRTDAETGIGTGTGTGTSSGSGSGAGSPTGTRRPAARTEPGERSRGGGRGDRRRLTALSVLLGVVASSSGMALTATAGWLIVRASQHPPVLLLLVAIVGVRTFGIARPLFRYLERLVAHDAALRMLAERRSQVYSALIPLTPGRLGLRRGDVLTSVVDDVEAWVDRRLRVWMPLVTLALTAGVAATVAALLLPVAALVDVSLVVVGGGVVFWVVDRAATRAGGAVVEQRARLGEAVTDLVEGAEELQAWGAAEAALDDAHSASCRMEELVATSSRRAAAGRAGTTLVVGVALAVSVGVVGTAVARQEVTAAMGALLVFIPLALAELLLPVADVAVAEVATRKALTRLGRLLSAAPAVLERAAPVPLASGPGGLNVDSVSADWGRTRALSGFSLDLPPGARVGVVGPSGSGKSTLAALLVRFVDPTAGAVRFAGTDLRDSTLDDVRRTIGLVDDDPYVFASTLAENVRLARPGCSDLDVESALRAAGLGPWLDDLPDSVQTWLGEGHRGVSGGERARLALARVILADPQVVVLDEPTAHLDGPRAREVMRTFFASSSQRSIVLITHRPEGLDLVDDILELDPQVRRRSPELAPSR